jgi:membrane-associated phospholipid phosphatase
MLKSSTSFFGKQMVVFSIAISALMTTFQGCKPDAPLPIGSVSLPANILGSEAPYAWNELFLEIDRYSPGYRPPAAARLLGYTSLAVYESVAPGMTKYKSIAPNFIGLQVPSADATKEYYWPAAANAAYGYMFRKFYPHIDAQYLTKIDQLEKTFEDKFAYTGVTSATLARSKAYGIAVATAVFNYSATDIEGHEAYTRTNPTSYVPPVGPGLWKQTGPDFTRALFPTWGNTRTFAARPADLIGLPPLAYGTGTESPLYVQAKEVYDISRPLSYENKWIAEFWGDDIFRLTFEPAGRWIAIANQIVKLKRSNLETTVLMYAKLGMALSDGGVAAWNTKFYYNIQRPSDYINDNIDPNWKSHLITLHNCVNPPFPAYPSGHATFGACAAGILNSVYGKSVNFTDNCHKGRTEFNGKPRTFTSFDAAAQENAYSRIPLGVHFRMDAIEGLRMGYVCADRVNALPWER